MEENSESGIQNAICVFFHPPPKKNRNQKSQNNLLHCSVEGAWDTLWVQEGRRCSQYKKHSPKEPGVLEP